MERKGRRGVVALGFALAALLACWNPLSAPFAAITALGAFLVASSAFGAPPPGGRCAKAGAVLAAVAFAASAAILAVSAGVGRGPTGEPIVGSRSPAEVERLLDEAAKESEETRARARRDLERLERTPLTPQGE